MEGGGGGEGNSCKQLFLIGHIPYYLSYYWLSTSFASQVAECSEVAAGLYECPGWLHSCYLSISMGYNLCTLLNVAAVALPVFKMILIDTTMRDCPYFR